MTCHKVITVSKENTYSPPFTITSDIVNLIAEISESIGYLSSINASTALKLRKANRVKTIQGSLAIEGNALPESQIIDIIDGKTVIAPPKEILEVKNAITVYEQFDQFSPHNEHDLLSAHNILMAGLINETGQYRSGSVGVVSDKKVIHVAPPAKRVPQLMQQLFEWLAITKEHVLISSCVFHYEFEFIHPFADGNGRMGRLWQSLLLATYNPLLALIPVESLIYQHQTEYYDAIAASTRQTNSYPFIQFMLSMLSEAITQLTPQDSPQVTPQVKMLLGKMPRYEVSRDELQNILALTDRKSFRNLYLKPSLDNGFIEMTIPDKPNSKLQKYRITQKGINFIKTRT